MKNEDNIPVACTILLNILCSEFGESIETVRGNSRKGEAPKVRLFYCLIMANQTIFDLETIGQPIEKKKHYVCKCKVKAEGLLIDPRAKAQHDRIVSLFNKQYKAA